MIDGIECAPNYPEISLFSQSINMVVFVDNKYLNIAFKLTLETKAKHDYSTYREKKCQICAANLFDK